MATFYIDPSAATNGVGSVSNPFNTWVGLTLTANNTYLQKRGTTYVGAAVRPISQVSNVTTPLTIGAYFNGDGSDDTTLPLPIINHNGGTNGVGAVFIDTCTNVLVTNIAGTNSMAALGGGVTLRRSQGVKIQGCFVYACEHGIVVQQDQASTTSTTTDIDIINCTIFNNVGAGICLRWGAVSTAILKRLRIEGNTVYSNGTGKTFGAGGVSVPCGGIQSYTQNKASIGTVGFTSYDIKVVNNNIKNNNGYGINIEGFYTESWSNLISKNIVTGSGYSGDVDSHSLWVGNMSGFIITDNIVYENIANINASTGSGVGIFLDYNALSSTVGANCVVKRNIIYNQYTNSTTAAKLAASAGILISYATGTVVESNLIYNCRNGIAIVTLAEGTQVKNNTVVNSSDGGICVLTGGTNTTVKNNCISGASTGLFCATGVTGYIETHNSIFNCTISKANGTPTTQSPVSLDVSDLTNNPLLSITYKPTYTSPLINQGTYLGINKDIENVQFNIPPSIGAYEYIEERAVR